MLCAVPVTQFAGVQCCASRPLVTNGLSQPSKTEACLGICPCQKARYEIQACEDCATTAAVLKLLDSFEGLLERPALAADLRREHQALVAELAADLAQVRTKPELLCDRSVGALQWSDTPALLTVHQQIQMHTRREGMSEVVRCTVSLCLIAGIETPSAGLWSVMGSMQLEWRLRRDGRACRWPRSSRRIRLRPCSMPTLRHTQEPSDGSEASETASVVRLLCKRQSMYSVRSRASSSP